MRTDRFSTPCPPEVLLSAYQVEPDTARGTGVPAAHRVADLTVLDGLLCAAVRAPVPGVTPLPAPVGGEVSGELLVVEGAAVWGTGFRGTGVRATPHHVPLRWPPAALTAVITDGGPRVFVLADGGGEIITIDLHRDTHLARPRAEIVGEIVLEPAPGAGRRPGPRSGGVRPAPSMAADSVLGRVYVSDPDRPRIAVIDAHRLIAAPGEVIELPARPGRLVLDEQDRTLFALLSPRGRPEIAVVDLVTGDADVLAVHGGDLRDIAYDNGSGLIFVATGGTGSSAPGVLVIDRDTGRTVGAPIRTAGSPTALAVMRAPGGTLLFCCVASTAATAHASGGSVEVVDVAHRAVVGRAPVLDGCDLVAVDQRAGDVFVAGSGSGRITRLAPRIGGTPIARHPAVACAGAGPALGGPRRTPDGTGWLQPFCRGTAVATNDIGAVLIDTDHAEDWLTSETTLGAADAHGRGSAVTRRGTDAGDRLGNPVADTMALAGRRVTYFERGLVVTSPERGQVVRVAGPVYPRYRELDDIAGPLGPPIASAAAGATWAVQQTFASGHIVHHPGSGTHVLEVAGDVNPGTSEGPDRAPVALDLVGSPSSGAGFGAFAVILLSGGAGVVQVTDEGGHRLSAAGGVMTGNGRPGEVAAGIPGLLRLARLPRHGAVPGGQLFSAIGEHAGLRFDVAKDRPADMPTDLATDSAADTPGAVAGTVAGTVADEPGEYCWAAWMAGCAVRVTAVATPVPDRLTAEHLGTPGRGISVEVPRDGSARPFAISIQAAGGARPRLPHVRKYFLDEVTIAAGQRISLRIDDGGAELLATNHGPPTSVLLRIGADGPGRPSPPRRVTLAAGATTVFRPLDWSAEGSASRVVCIEVRDTPNGPARVAIADLGGDLPDVR